MKAKVEMKKYHGGESWRITYETIEISVRSIALYYIVKRMSLAIDIFWASIGEFLSIVFLCFYIVIFFLCYRYLYLLLCFCFSLSVVFVFYVDFFAFDSMAMLICDVVFCFL